MTVEVDLQADVAKTKRIALKLFEQVEHLVTLDEKLEAVYDAFLVAWEGQWPDKDSYAQKVLSEALAEIIFEGSPWKVILEEEEEEPDTMTVEEFEELYNEDEDEDEDEETDDDIS
jgi:hypothetical protein